MLYPVPLAKFRTPLDKMALVIATGLGSGFFPFAPGTAGSVAALPLVIALKKLDAEWQLVLFAVFVAVGVWSAQRVSIVAQQADHRRIVIDEVAGMVVACAWIGGSLMELMAGFMLFRIFDVAKFPPVGWLDRWSKKSTRWAGVGIMADDLVAGLQAALVLWGLSRYFAP